ATSLATISGLIGLWTGFNPIKMKAACHETRACGLYGMYMTYGYGIALFQVLVTGLLLYRKKFEHLIKTHWIAIAFFINLLGLVFSYARGAWIAYAIACPFLFIKSYPKRFIQVAVLSVITLILSIAFIPKVKNMFFNRHQSNVERISFYTAAFYAFKEKPFFGYGYKNFEPNTIKLKWRYKIPHLEKPGHAHSNYLEHLASTGGLGVIALLLFCFSWLYKSWKKSEILLSFVIAFMISGLFQYTFGDGENLFLMMGVFAFF
ncbi:MAG: O-antigen ligase family protein, partial [Bacteriovoracaceae bacterium]